MSFLCSLKGDGGPTIRAWLVLPKSWQWNRLSEYHGWTDTRLEISLNNIDKITNYLMT